MYKNVVILSIDSLRADGFYHNRKSIYGNKAQKIHTPNLDRLAQLGTSFTKAYSTNTYTTSAHASLFTGEYPPVHGIRAFFDFDQYLSKDTQTIAEKLNELGYQSFFYSDIKDLFSEMNIWRGFKVRTYGKSDWFFNSVADLKKDKNLIFYHTFDIHEPYLYIEDESRDKDINTDYYDSISELRKELGINSKINQEKEPHKAFHEIRQFLIKNQLDHKKYLKKYYDLGVEKFDKHSLPLFIDNLDKLGITLDNSLFIILSDHGEGRAEFKNSLSFAHVGELTEETIRISLIVNKKLKNRIISIRDIKDLTLKNLGINTKVDSQKLKYAEHFQFNITVYSNKESGGVDALKKSDNLLTFLNQKAYLSEDNKIIVYNKPNMQVLLDDSLSNDQFVDQLYINLFRRFPDVSGKQHHLNLLRKGVSKIDLIKGFINSSEYRNLPPSLLTINTKMLKDEPFKL